MRRRPRQALLSWAPRSVARPRAVLAKRIAAALENEDSNDEWQYVRAAGFSLDVLRESIEAWTAIRTGRTDLILELVADGE
jgi:hypothetical protein